jgi:hypothetical protein
MLNINQIDNNNKLTKLWKCFSNAININKKGSDGKTRILSIIANAFKYEDIKKNIKVFIKTFLILYNLIF